MAETIEETSLSPDQYGRLAALKVHHGNHFPEALRLRGLRVRDFERAEEHWMERLRRAAVDDDRPTLQAFASAFAAERERLAKESPKLPPEQPTGESAGESLDPDVTHPPFRRTAAVLPFREAAEAALATRRPEPRPDPRPEPRNEPRPEPRPESADALDGTLMIQSPLRAVELPGFGAALTPTLVPQMSLDAYAMLQAELRVSPQSLEPLRRAGIPSEGALLALRQRFFQLFQSDPHAQAEFQTRFRAHLARLTGGAR
jgi:hypothetical protein